MSVYGEFHRYLETLIERLEARGDASDHALIAVLRSARPDTSANLSESACKALGALREHPEDKILQEECEDLRAIGRIVVGG